MTNKEKYRDFCKRELNIPIFSKDWWLDAVCVDGKWDVALVEKGGEIVASMPYFIKKEGMFKVITMPALTQTMGPYIKYPHRQKYYKRLSWEKELMTKLIEQLPKFDSFNQSFHHSITNWLPFYWKGFNFPVRYTYVIENIEDLELVYQSFDKSAKKNIKKAIKERISIIDSDNIKKFYEVNSITFKKQNVDIPYSFNFINRLYLNSKKNNALIMKFAVKNDLIYSVMLAVFDNKNIYMLAGSSNRNIQTFGAEYYLYWEMIKEANLRGLNFDFGGSMMENIEIINC